MQAGDQCVDGEEGEERKGVHMDVWGKPAVAELMAASFLSDKGFQHFFLKQRVSISGQVWEASGCNFSRELRDNFSFSACNQGLWSSFSHGLQHSFSYGLRASFSFGRGHPSQGLGASFACSGTGLGFQGTGSGAASASMGAVSASASGVASVSPGADLVFFRAIDCHRACGWGHRP